ncbi:unnamed protein product, partial [Sphacelaria rigidula]
LLRASALRPWSMTVSKCFAVSDYLYDQHTASIILKKNNTGNDWYVKQCYRQLNDPTTYRPIRSSVEVEADMKSKNDAMIKTLEKLNIKFNLNWHPFRTHTTWMMKFIRHASSQDRMIPNFYIIPKIHKPVVFGRPIVAGHSFHTNPWLSLLCHWLQSVAGKLTTVLKDSITLIRDLETNRFNNRQRPTLVTADVTSLYPFLQIPQVIEHTMPATRRHYKHDWPQNMFVLIEKINALILQITGLAMDTPSAPTLANIALAIVDNNFVINHRNILFFKRYVDDIFCVVQANPEDSNALMSRIYTDMQLKVPCNTSVNSRGNSTSTPTRKKLNLYGYMPFRSPHSIHKKRGFITEELLRYIATNTDEDKFKQLRICFTFGYLPEDIPTRSCSQFSQERDTRNAPTDYEKNMNPNR